MSPGYDAVVVGSGAGGSSAAGRLAELGARVLVVEAGERATRPDDAFDAVLRYYAHGGFWAPAGNCLLPVPTGRTLGGTTTINSGTCFDTPRELLERWERGSRGAFDAGAFQESLAEARRRIGAKTAPASTMSRCSELFLRGAERLGLAGGHLLDRAETGCEGAGRCCFVCPTGAKTTADRAFLAPLDGKPELRVAERTSLRWVEPAPRPGARVRAGLRGKGGDYEVTCRWLILACGALATPYFVRRFRLGTASRAAGDALSVHPAAKLFARFDEAVDGWKGVPQGAGLVDPGLPGLRFEGVYTPPDLAAVTLPLEGRALREWLDGYERVATFGLMVRDTARGRVRYPFGPAYPLIRYDLAASDARLIAAGLLQLARIFFAAGAREALLPFVTEPNRFGSAEALSGRDATAAEPWELQLMAFHPLGTCGMGRVVGWDLSAGGGVYVCDGSAVPEPLGVNPQVTLYALGLRLAERLAAGRPAEAAA